MASALRTARQSREVAQNQYETMLDEQVDAAVRLEKFRAKMAERGLSFPDPDAKP